MGGHPSIAIDAHAKLNLLLNVVGKRPDGFHDIETVFHRIDLADTLELSLASERGVRVSLAPDAAEAHPAPVPLDEANLAARAAALVLEEADASHGVDIVLHKRIPVGAGLGGGSADAAATLVGLGRLLLGADAERRLHALAARIGSDVPFLLAGATAVGRGKGDELVPLHAPEPMWFVLGITGRPLATADVYSAWTPGPRDRRSTADAMAAALAAGDVARVASLLHNDLERPAFALRPELREAKAAFLRAGALGACMSGSGPTLYGIASDEGHASGMAAGLREVFDAVVVARSLERAAASGLRATP